MANDNGWFMRPDNLEYDIQETYGIYQELFSINLHHHGKFIQNPKRQYFGGMINPFDFIETTTFCMEKLNAIVKEVVNVGDEVMYYHFRIPDSDLDNGLSPLARESDVVKMLSYIPRFQFIDVYVENGVSDVGKKSLIDEIDAELALSETVFKCQNLSEGESDDGSEEDESDDGNYEINDLELKPNQVFDSGEVVEAEGVDFDEFDCGNECI